MEWVETTGKTVAEALDTALNELGVDERDAEFEIIEEPHSGLFGLRRSEARVRARVRPAAPRPKRPQRGRRGDERGRGGRGRSSGARRSTDRADDGADQPQAEPSGAPAPAARDARAGQSRSTSRRRPNREAPSRVGTTETVEETTMSIEDQARSVGEFVSGVIDRFGYDAETAARVEDDNVVVEVKGDGLGLLVGPRGATLDALQELARTVVQRRGDERGARVVLDVGGFRARRAEALEGFVRRVAGEVVSSGVAQALEPMSAPDRKIVHDVANVLEGVSTTSEGVEPRRFVVIRPSGATTESATESVPESVPTVDPDDD